MNDEATLVVIKPDAIQRGLTGLVLYRLEEAKLSMVGAKVMRVSRELAVEHYKALREKAFFDELIQHICGELHGIDHVLALIYMGPGAIGKVRQISGSTHPEKADPTSLRGAFGRMTTSGIMENIIHASSDPADAEREIKLWFRPDEMIRTPYPTKPSSIRSIAWA